MASAWRFVALAGLTAGLCVAPSLGGPGGAYLLVAAAGAGLGLASVRPRSQPAACAWLALVAAAAVTAGLGFGSMRVAAIDAGALDLAPGSRVTVAGFVAAVPRRADGEVSVRIDTPEGRVLVQAPEPVADLDIGAGITATGTIRLPAEFERDYLARLGIGRILAAGSIALGEERRGGLLGLLDRVRARAQLALSTGTPPASSTLLRGFVLGQDDRIAAATVDDFKRTGLAHLLAVSGQNVVLLAILAALVLSLAGVSIRARLVWILVLIGVYVLVTGAGPSIQRAGVMGAAGVAAALAGRPRSRWYIVVLAAAVTLGLNPRAAGDIGWQLSFAAVVGILLFCAPLARVLAGPDPGRARRALAEATALTISATLATAPLMSLQFGVVSLVSLPANLAAVVAEAPVMWLGMLAAACGQLAWIPIEPITWLAGLLAAYIAQVAAWFARPGWAQVALGVDGVGALVAIYAALGGGLIVALRWTGRRRSLRLRTSGRRGRRRLGVASCVAITVAVALLPRSGGLAVADAGLRVSVLDVGQGDSILLDPADGAPVLVDTGPPDARVAERLAEHGVGPLAALVVTHADSDHGGGAADVLDRLGAEHLLFARASPATLGAARATAVDTERVGAGSVLRTGSLRLAVLWPPPELTHDRGGASEPNALALVLLARWHGFRMLLASDAEAELAPIHPGDVDVLKVAHHGSDDAGLPALLTEAQPELAVISVGEDNPYGHPTAATLAALDHQGAAVLRTDTAGEITISATERAWSVTTDGPGGLYD
jgi:competence protein ComEC